jgi:hypothetical protein
MSMPAVREFKIAGPKGDGRHAYLNENGVFIGRGTPLLEKDADGRWRPRQRQLLESLLTKGYGGEVDLESRMSGLRSVAAALNKGDIGLARIALVLAQFPPLPNAEGGCEMAEAYSLFVKYSDDQPRAARGSPEGGRWISADSGQSGTAEGGGGTKIVCEEEWASARTFCRNLEVDGLLGTSGYKGFGKTFEQCVRGMVSARCGGNAVG